MDARLLWPLSLAVVFFLFFPRDYMTCCSHVHMVGLGYPQAWVNYRSGPGGTEWEWYPESSTLLIGLAFCGALVWRKLILKAPLLGVLLQKADAVIFGRLLTHWVITNIVVFAVLACRSSYRLSRLDMAQPIHWFYVIFVFFVAEYALAIPAAMLLGVARRAVASTYNVIRRRGHRLHSHSHASTPQASN